MTIFFIQVLLALSISVSFFLSIKLLNLRKIINKPYRILLLIGNAIIVLVLIFFFLTSMNYKSAEFKEPVANVVVQKIKEQHFNIFLSIKEQERLVYEIYGDMWQIDFRLLIWKDFWQLLNLNTLYQFDRVSGRYQDINDEKNKLRSVYDLSRFKLGNELHKVWQQLDHVNLLPSVDAKYGSGAYVPLRDGAEYQIIILRSGVQIKAVNNIAVDAISSW